MTLLEMIKQVGEVPTKFTLDGGQKFELFTRRKMYNKGYIVTIWQMIGDVQHEMIWNATGQTIEGAKENLKNKILKS